MAHVLKLELAKQTKDEKRYQPRVRQQFVPVGEGACPAELSQQLQNLAMEDIDNQIAVRELKKTVAWYQ